MTRTLNDIVPSPCRHYSLLRTHQPLELLARYGYQFYIYNTKMYTLTLLTGIGLVWGAEPNLSRRIWGCGASASLSFCSSCDLKSSSCSSMRLVTSLPPDIMNSSTIAVSVEGSLVTASPNAPEWGCLSLPYALTSRSHAILS